VHGGTTDMPSKATTTEIMAEEVDGLKIIEDMVTKAINVEDFAPESKENVLGNHNVNHYGPWLLVQRNNNK